MKLSIWLFVVSLLTSVSAYSDPGAYERLWYYYAYTLDTAGNKVAPGCSGSAAGKRCTFAEFMKYIDVSPENMLNTLENVDPTDVPKAFNALVAGHYTGPYRCNLIYNSIKGKNDVAPLMKAITGFLEGSVGGASDATKTALQTVTKAVAGLRLTASLPSVTEYLEGKGITVQTGPYQYLTDSTETVEYLDVQGTAAASGVTPKTIGGHVRNWIASDPGHSNNIKASKAGQAAVAAACTG